MRKEINKILILGPLFYGYTKSVAKAFTNLGYNAHIYDKWVEGQVENYKEKIEFNLTKNKDVFFRKKYVKFNEQVLSEYDKVQPEMVFIIRGAILSRETLQHMKKKSKLILWMMDSIFYTHATLENADLYDTIFLFEKEDIPLLKEKYNIDSFFLPLALDETVYFPISSTHKPIDILFVGNLYPQRIEILNRLISKFPNLNIHIYGYYFSPLRNLKRYFFRKDKKQYTNKIISPNKLNTLYSQTRICLNMHHNQSVYGVNQRFFEISGAKALQICDRHGFIDDNFKTCNMLIYENETEMHNLIEKVIADDKVYNNSIDLIYKKVLNEHTFNNRVKFIMEKISA